jgi:pSer/pThr/pTyr-binding forkhead associated (FHA) protein
MPITVLVRSATGDDARLTFDGTQRVVIGRGSSCDVRLPDTSVSHRHAVLRAQGADFVVVDEGSTIGTFVGGVRVAARTSRIVRSGDLVRVGRVWLELRIDQTRVTRDVAAATRDLALALVAQALEAVGEDRTPKVRVVEGPDQGRTLALVEEGRAYVVGRGAACDLPIADQDASREHAQVVRRGSVVELRDLGAKNGTWLAGARAPAERAVLWRPAQMVQIGRTVMALEEPIADALARIESSPDEALPEGAAAAAPPAGAAGPAPSPPASSAALDAAAPASASLPSASPASSAAPGSARPGGAAVESNASAAPALVGAKPRERARSGWSVTDLVVIAAAVSVLVLSIAGLVWLLRG